MNRRLGVGMNLIKKIIGPKSKYDKGLPYTYEAKVACWDGADEYNSYFSDTICGVISYLEKKNIRPVDARVFEIYGNQETEMDVASYSYSEQDWFKHNDVCQSFCKNRYPGHVSLTDCSFSDRDRDCSE